MQASARALHRWPVIVAALSWLTGVWIFGLRTTGYRIDQHPVALLGAQGMPMAWLFNALVFIVPGALLGRLAWQMRAAITTGASWRMRIGMQLLLLSALMFGALGVCVLDLQDMDGGSSSLHAAAWSAWWMAHAVAMLLLSTHTRWRYWCIAGLGSPLLVVLGPRLLPGAPVQLAAVAAWFAWWSAVPQFQEQDAA